MNQDQMLLAGALGHAAFLRGKPCSPASDEEFLRFLKACGNRAVGQTPAGEAPTLALLRAWIAQWQRAQCEQTLCPVLHADQNTKSDSLGLQIVQLRLSTPAPCGQTFANVIQVAV